MGNTRRTHEHDALTDAAWQVALTLDNALDHLTLPEASSPEHQGSLVGSTNGHPPTDQAGLLVEAARHLSALNTAQPDTAFATSLRQTLVKPATASPPPASSAPVSASLGIQPALPPIHRNQHRPTLRYAAMLIAVILLLGSLVGSESIVHRLADLTDRQPEPARSDDIPIFRNDPAGAAAHPGPGPTGPASIAWQFRAGASLTGNPVIANGIIYVGAFNQRLYAIDAASGTELWSIDAGGTVRDPAVVDGVVYFVTGANDLVAVDATTAVERWRVSFDTGMVRPPTVVDGTVYLSTGTIGSNHPAVANGTVYTGGGPYTPESSDRSELYAIDAANGAIRWTFPTGDTLAVYAIDTATGQLRWRTLVDSAPWGAPAVADGSVFISTGKNGPVLAMDADTGQLRWQYDASAGYGPVVVDGVVYGANFALNPETGRELWRIDAAKPIAAAPAVVDDTAYLMTEWGTLYSVDTQSGAERWHTVIGLHIVYALSPIVTGGKVYVAASDGALYALGDQSSDSHVAALPRDVPNPDECAVTPVDPATVAAVHPTEPQPFVWPLGSPADDATVAEVSTAYRDLVACLNAGDPRRIYPLYTSRYWQISTSRGGTPPDVILAGETAPLGVDEQIAIRSISDAEILPDGRVGVRTITESRTDQPHGVHTTYLIFAQVDGRWLVDEVVPISQSTEIPPVSIPALDPASTSATQADTGCTVEPADLESLAATVNASPEASQTLAPTPTTVPLTEGTPADRAVTDAVHLTIREWVACGNTGESARRLSLYTPEQVTKLMSPMTGGGLEWSPDPSPAPATPLPESEQATIRAMSLVQLLPDGRARVDVTLGVGNPNVHPPQVTIILVDNGDRWLIDDLIPSENEPIPGAPSGNDTSSATPTIGTSSSGNYPVGSTVLSRLNTVVLRSIPRTIGEHIARLPGPRSLTVAGAIVDSGDGLWLPVTDVETGVFGYLSVSDVLPPAQHTLYSHLVGKTVTSDAPIYLRPQPEPSSAANEPLPAGTQIRVNGDTISQGLAWLRVEDPTSGVERWILPDVLSFEQAGIGGSSPAPATTASPNATSADVITVPIPVNLRDGATFAARAFEVAAPGSMLIPIGPPVQADGILWIRVEGQSEGSPRFLPAAYLTATGARVPGVPALTDEGIGIPDPSECRIDPMPLVDIAAYMGPTVDAGQQSAMTYLATGVGLHETDSLSGRDRSDIEQAVLTTLREAIACQNAGSFAQSVALYTQDYFQHAGAESFRPDGSESQLATPQPLPAENRTEILEIGELALLDDGRVGVIVITAAHTELTQVTAAYVILAETGDRWLIDDTIPIDASVSPGGYLIPAAPLDPTTTPTAAVVSTGTGVLVEDYFTAETVVPPTTFATTTAQPSALTTSPHLTFPLDSVVTGRPDATTVAFYSQPTTNSTFSSRSTLDNRPRRVSGPLTDSGDNLWLPVTEDVIGGGYIPLNHLAAPETVDQSGFQVGDTYRTTAPIQLRRYAEATIVSDLTVPEGSTITITDMTYRFDFLWLLVSSSSTGESGWIHPDLLLAALSNDGDAVATTTPVAARNPEQSQLPISTTEASIPTPTLAPNVAAPTEPSQQAVAQLTFPIGSTVAVRGTTVNLHSLPRSNAEVIARLGPCACAMEVFGPMADSGDALWLPVTDLDTGVSGYVSLDFVLPPERMDQTGLTIGQSIVTTATLRLRGVPEPSAPADTALSAGTSLQISAIKISVGILWIGVDDPSNGGLKWVPWDLLLGATTADTRSATPAATSHAGTSEFTPGQRAIVTADAVTLRDAPGSESNYLEFLMEGDQIEITGAPEEVDSKIWYPVRAIATGAEGFVSGYFLQGTPPQNDPPTPTPTK